MKSYKHIWIIGLGVTLLGIIVPIFIYLPRETSASQDPKANVAVYPHHTDHKDIVQGTFETPQQVTQACLVCHPEAASVFMATTHWTWESRPFDLPWRDKPVTIGEKNQINNFCIGTQGNSKKCMICHTGNDWQELVPDPAAGDDQIRYLFPAALGARYPCADPDPEEFKIEFTPKVQLQTKRGATSGGCG